MNPKQFLQIGGVVLIVVGILGFVGVIGPEAKDSIFGSAWWFDNAENWVHLILGVVALLAAFALPTTAQKPLVIVLGVVGVLVAIYSAFVSKTLGAANLENPADTLLHLVVGVWALWAALREEMPMSKPATPAS